MATLSAAFRIALAHHEAGRLDLAEEIYRRILAQEPQHAQTLHLLGVIAQQQRRHQAAIDSIARAIAIDGRQPHFHSNLGEAYRALGKIPEAIACYRRTIELQPDFAEAHNNLGLAWQAIGKLDEAIACYQRAIAIAPGFAEAHNNLGTVWCDQGKIVEAIACYELALQLDPSLVGVSDSLLSALYYRPGITPAELLQAHTEYERRHAARLRATWRPHDNTRDPERPLRLGFVSADLGRHPTGCFLVRVLENLDRGRCAAVCYSDRVAADAMTARLRAVADEWSDVAELSDEQLAERIRADHIDILFDLAGHTAGNRLLMFARKPAPLAISWIGYPGTTGLAAIDYLLADRHQVPPAAEPYFSEKVLHMPEGYVCFDPPADAPPVGPLPAQAGGRVTFGSFNNPAKMGPDVVATWSRILARLPESRLMLKYIGLDSATTQARFRQLLADGGISADRVEFGSWAPWVELLGSYNQVDVALDPFPYSGGLTTCEALWMGVPVVTWPGETFASRHSLSHLSTAGLTETIAGSREAYVELAVGLAEDLPRLAEIRAGLRQRVAASPLCDGKRFAQNLMNLLRDAWRRWCRRAPAPGD